MSRRDPRISHPRGSRRLTAARLGAIKSVELLLARGADATLKDFFGTTAIDCARDRNYSRNAPAIVRLLEAAMK